MDRSQDIDFELQKLRALAWRMDALFTIPRTRITIGLDNIVGLIPVVGDLIAITPSLYTIQKAYKLGATPGALAYMIFNTTLDVVIGSIPVIGDIFDVLYNSNIRNFRALERNLNKQAFSAREIRKREKLGAITP